VASQLEEPFPSLPLQDIFNTYERDINRISQELREIGFAIAEGCAAGPSENRLTTTWDQDGEDSNREKSPS
jgi:hypothetical protein